MQSPTLAEPKRRRADDRTVAEAVRLVFDGRYESDHQDIRETLLDPIFEPRVGLTLADAGLLAYERSRFVHGRIESPVEVVRNPRRLFALAEWPSLLDVSVFSLLMVHYNLCLGTVVDHGDDRADLADHLGELESLNSFGQYMATELGYGNNVAAMRTEAVYDATSDTFVVNTPDALAQKFMSYSGFSGIPKLALVLARMHVGDEDHGVFPFLVRISDRNGPCEGVHTAPCPEKPVQGLDNGVTWFDHVRIPSRNLLLGDMGAFQHDATFRRTSRNQRKQFLKAMTRIQPGRLCVSSAAIGAGRASVYIALRYASQRLTNAPGRNDMPIIGYRSHQLSIFTALSKVYAMTFLVNYAKQRYVERQGDLSAELGNLISITKVLSTWEISDVVAVCRERCGAQGMFSVNRIADYVSLLQGLVTAEGDNQVLLANAGAQLLTHREEPEDLEVPLSGDLHVTDPVLHVALLRCREHQLGQAARRAMTDGSTDQSYFETWNATVNSASAMARLRGVRIALERCLAAASTAESSRVREAVCLLASLYGLTEIQRDAGYCLAKGLLTGAQVEQIPHALDTLCERIAPHATLLIDAFQLSPELLRAPIAADDYVAAYQRIAGPTGSAGSKRSSASSAAS
ncbi:MAG: acyl-CoA dehydrogenase family protein [Solirubrobacteraceae bacterium]